MKSYNVWVTQMLIAMHDHESQQSKAFGGGDPHRL